MLRMKWVVGCSVVGLSLVSLGLSQTTPAADDAVSNTKASPFSIQPAQPALPFAPPLPPGTDGVTRPVPAPPPSLNPVIPNTLPVPEKMLVKVYAVQDLVADSMFGTPPTSSLTNMPLHVAAAAQQAQAYAQAVQAVQASVQAVATPQLKPVPDEIGARLERLAKVLQITASKKAWSENGGEGEIAIFPDTLSLIVRQSPAVHEDIENLLTQLRASRSLQIELSIEILDFSKVAAEAKAGLMALLNRDLKPDELVKLRSATQTSPMSFVVRMNNGGWSNNWAFPGLPLKFHAITTPDHQAVEFHGELELPLEAMADSDSMEMSAAYNGLLQRRSVADGSSMAQLFGPEGEGIVLITAKVIDRSAASSVKPEAASK